MKKKVPLIICSLLLYSVVIFLSVYYVIMPNVKEVKRLNDNMLNESDKIVLRDTINEKYDLLIQELNDNNTKRKEEINSLLITKKADKTNEFFKNHFSEKYYTLESEINDLENELSLIDIDAFSSISKFNSQKQEEINNIDTLNDEYNFSKFKSILFIILGGIIIIIPLIYIWFIFNCLTTLYNLVRERWSEVDVYLKQRADLIPNIVETVKAYTKYEGDTLVEVTNARNKVLNASSKNEEIVSNEKFDKTIDKIFALVEAYPELKANANFMNLQDDLRNIEEEIAHARKRYNNAVLMYKNKMEIFPSNLVANMFDFKPEMFFEISKDSKDGLKIEI